jgi:hypothetical protein
LPTATTHESLETSTTSLRIPILAMTPSNWHVSQGSVFTIDLRAFQIGFIHQGREIIAIVPLENGAFCTIFSENFYKF